MEEENDIRNIVRDEIRKSKTSKRGEFIFLIVILLIATVFILQPLAIEVIFPYWGI